MTRSLAPETFQKPRNLRTEKFQFEILELSFAAEARFQISLEASDEIRILSGENHHADIIDNELPAKMNLSDENGMETSLNKQGNNVRAKRALLWQSNI